MALLTLDQLKEEIRIPSHLMGKKETIDLRLIDF